MSFADPDEVAEAAKSDDLRRLATDGAFASGASSSVIVSDGVDDVAEDDLDTFLRAMITPLPTSYEVETSTLAMTQATTPEMIPGLTWVVPASGRYEVCASVVLDVSQIRREATVAIYVDGVQVAETERAQSSAGQPNLKFVVATPEKLLDLDAGQVVETYWSVDAGAPATLTAYQRMQRARRLP